MNLATVTAIRPEIESALIGRRFGKIFQLAKFDLAIDLRLGESNYLFISTEPGNPRTYLIRRRLRDLEKASVNPGPFSLTLRKRLSSAEVTSVSQVPGERVLLIGLTGVDELETHVEYTLAIQLTGTSANLFLLDADSVILDAMKQTRGRGQQVGEKYEPPTRRSSGALPKQAAVSFPTGRISETLDAEDLDKAAATRFESLAAAARNKLKQELSKRKKLVGKLNEDLAGHGDAEQWKRYGDLLLANVANARREGGKVFVTDYFDPASPEIAIEVDENDPITAAAEKFFRKYTKARNAAREIEERLKIVEKELATLSMRAEQLEDVIAAGDGSRLMELVGAKAAPGKVEKRKRNDVPSGVRVFISTDGLEILVGKKATDNDFLTFRLAKSLDTWMHAADYPGSHVVIRNPTRKDVPQKTLLEAAQLAAFYSQGKSQPKAAVHYTQKKFVNKPKGAAPGLVSLASFKTLLVEPKVGAVTLKGG